MACTWKCNRRARVMIPIRFGAVPVAPFTHSHVHATPTGFESRWSSKCLHTAELSTSMFAVRNAISAMADESEQSSRDRGPKKTAQRVPGTSQLSLTRKVPKGRYRGVVCRAPGPGANGQTNACFVSVQPACTRRDGSSAAVLCFVIASPLLLLLIHLRLRVTSVHRRIPVGLYDSLCSVYR